MRTFVLEFVRGRKQNMVTPTPTKQLAKLLEDQEVQYASCCHFAVIVARYLAPMKASDSLGQRDDQRDG